MAEQVPGRVPGRLSEPVTVVLPPAAPGGTPDKAADMARAVSEITVTAADTVRQPSQAVPADPSGAEERSAPRDRAPGWREVLIIAAVVVGAVLAVQVVTSYLPGSVQDLLFRTPLTIVLLITATVGLLIRISRRPST
ncbi:MAG TPA: hypothetical protein VNF73_16830 [Candidatus Saccharimonadales bacterium]|nr:hypothetical protein [Candidatus Saccharimonadales bacterium]